MKETKLIRLLKTFTKSEWKEFEKFVASPYFNKGRNFKPFVRELKKFHPAFDSEKLTKQHLYKCIHPGKQFKETVINTMTSGLYALAEEFQIYEGFRNNFFKTPILIRQYSIKKMNNEVSRLINKTLKDFSNDTTIKDNYYDKQETYVEVLNHLTRNDSRNLIPENILKSFSFGFYFWIQRVLTLRNFLFINRNFMSDFKNNIIDKTLSSIDMNRLVNLFEETDEENALAFLLSYYNYMADISVDNKKYFFRIKELFEKYQNRMTVYTKKAFVVSLSNICLKNITYGFNEFHAEFEKVYSIILKEKLYTRSDIADYFDKRLFRVIILSGLYLKKMKWVEEFIKKYIDSVDPQFKEQLFYYSTANIEFAKKNYTKALQNSVKIEQKQVIYKIDTKNLIARIYYETKSFEQLNSLLDTYRHLIKNSELQDDAYKSSHLNFIKILENILKTQQKNDNAQELFALKQKAEKFHPVNNLPWLLEKISELSNPVNY